MHLYDLIMLWCKGYCYLKMEFDIAFAQVKLKVIDRRCISVCSFSSLFDY